VRSRYDAIAKRRWGESSDVYWQANAELRRQPESFTTLAQNNCDSTIALSLNLPLQRFGI
jgi:hypothetical protein